MDKRYGKGMMLLAALLLGGAAAGAQELLVSQRLDAPDATVCGLPVTGVRLEHNAGQMTLGMALQLGGYRLHDDRVSVFTPLLVNGSDTLAFDPVGVYSRIRYIQYLRYGSEGLGGERETIYRYSDRPEQMSYVQTVPYEEWMNGAQLYLQRRDYGCCFTVVDELSAPLGAWSETVYAPAYHYVMPKAEQVKLRELEGRAYIDFPVNRTELYPDYRNNPRELAKIIATIDSVRNDADVTVKRITIKGWASPESPWENNTRLAKGRTATLKQYVQNLYRFPEGFIETDYYPEDWIGLREFVTGSGLEHKQEILAIIDDPTLEPDPKEDKLKSMYPDEYKFLLQTVYPGLRHSDYTIEYTVRRYNDPEEIARVLAEAPQKLSLNERFVLAQSLEAGGAEYDEVFETAVRMYPNDETANLNAANAAMRRGDLAGAEKYLAKAGTGAAADYARGLYAALTGDLKTATALYARAADTIPEAAAALERINEIQN